MAGRNSPFGGNKTTSLLRGAGSTATAIADYQDSIASFEYANSAHTDDAFQKYSDYLQKRISLLGGGDITSQQKALNLTKTLESAYHQNVSSSILRENIQIMAGNSTLSDKYNLVSDQFSRAVANGDLTLAQSLENQAYSVNQQIQYQAQQSAQAGVALAKAATASAVYGQQSIQASLDEAQKQLTHGISEVGIHAADKAAADWVTSNHDMLASMGVVIPAGAQPNYWNLVEGIQAAKYNSLVLEAQAKAPTDPKAAQALAFQASNLMNGVTKVGDTLAGSLTVQEIQQASSDPNMFKFNNATGKYERSAQSGYQYLTDQQTGQKYVAPVYSGKTGAQLNQMVFLNPNQTSQMHALGLDFTMNQNGKSVDAAQAKNGQYGTTGDGVEVSTTNNTPAWLKAAIGDRTKVFADKNGDLQFEGNNSSGSGMSYFSLMNVGGLYGLFEHGADGSINLTGGNYGFNSGAAQLLINQAQQKQYQVQLQTQAEAAAQAAQIKLQLAQPAQLPQIQPVSQPSPVQNPSSPTAAIQPAMHTTAIQPANYSPQSATFNPQQAVVPKTTVQGVSLTQPKLNTIAL